MVFSLSDLYARRPFKHGPDQESLKKKNDQQGDKRRNIHSELQIKRQDPAYGINHRFSQLIDRLDQGIIGVRADPAQNRPDDDQPLQSDQNSA